jgi:hypothetical protein
LLLVLDILLSLNQSSLAPATFKTMQWIFATLLELLIGFLESAFKRDPRFAESSSSTGKDDDDDFYSNNKNAPGDGNEKKLNQAYTFMELTPPVSQAELKKRYKKLSLKYHPDRNQGSEESHAQMTKLNACFDLIEQELQGPVEENETENDNGDEGSTPGDGQQPPPPRDMRKEYEKMRKDMQREMQEELARYNKLKEDFQTNKRINQKECRQKAQAVGLDTKEGRQAAHESFSRQFKKETEPSQDSSVGDSSSTAAEEPTSSTTNMHDIDEHSSPQDSKTKEPQQQQGETATSSTAEKDGKPKNLIMEYNSSDIMVAFRMGMTEIAMELLQEELQTFAKERTLDARFTGEMITPKDLRYEFLARSLDDDQNALIHYAIYYEDYEMIRALCQMAMRDQSLDKVLYQANVHGETPLVYAKIAKERQILELVQAQITLAEQILARTQALPALKHAGQRLWGLVRHVDLVTALSSVLSFYIGYAVFQFYNVVTLVGFLLTQLVTSSIELGPGDAHGILDVTVLMSYYVSCNTVAILFRRMLPYIGWELVILLGPIAMAACCGCCCASKKRRQLCSPVAILLLVPVLMFSLLLATWLHEKITPKIITDRGFVKPFFLCIWLVVSKGIQALL